MISSLGPGLQRGQPHVHLLTSASPQEGERSSYRVLGTGLSRGEGLTLPRSPAFPSPPLHALFTSSAQSPGMEGSQIQM